MGRHCNNNNLKSQFSKTFLDKIDFLYKTECIIMILLYMWVEDELMNTKFTSQNQIFQFSKIFSIVIPIVNKNVWPMDESV